MDIAAWLKQPGPARYEAAFRHAELSPAALPELTDTDLRQLGLPLGPRKAVLTARKRQRAFRAVCFGGDGA